jgi:Spy/CpxP family protein refolding chaperone
MNQRTLTGLLIFVSLALNLFFFGWFFSHPWAHHPHRNPPPFTRMMEQVDRLPQPEQAQVKAIVASYKPQLDAQMERLQTSRDKLQKILRSEHYRRAEADAQFDAMQADRTRIHAIVKKMLLDVNEKLSPAERVQIMPPPDERR